MNDLVLESYKDAIGKERLESPKEGDVIKLSSCDWYIFEYGKWRLMTSEEQELHSK